MERVVFDRMAELDQQHWWYVARRRILLQVIGKFVALGKGAKILEIGCGTGHNLAMLAQLGHVDACEMDDAARELASKRLGREVRQGTLPDLSAFEPGSYDLIALLDVLEHVPDDRAALDSIRNLLKLGGSLVVTVPANQWMWSAHDVAHHHFRRYSKNNLKQLVQATNYEITLLSYFNTLLFPLIGCVRIVKKLLGRNTVDDALPSATTNRLLEKIFGAEAQLIGTVKMPAGTSLIAILRRGS